MSADVLILGAGPAGLGAAYRVAQTGRRVRVIEREPCVGGLAASFEVAGQRVDHGSHRLHPSTPEPIMATLRSLLGDDLQRRPRHGRIRMAGRFVAFPPKAADLVRHFPPALSARLALDMATSPFRRARADTFAEVVRASLGPTMTDRFYAPYVEKLFGVPATGLAGELARRRVGARSASALVRRVVRPDPNRGIFFYPRRGYGQISEVLADAATAAGAEILTSTDVSAIDATGVTSGDGGRHDAAMVWSTLPLALVARLASAPDDVLAAAARLETRALLLVYLALPTCRWTEFDAHYFPEADVPLSRISECKNYRDSADDPRDVTVLCAEVPCALGDRRWNETSDELAAQVRDAIARSALAIPTPIDVAVRRVPRAYPIYRLGYEQPFAALDAWASSQPNFLHFGRQGLFAHDNTHHALAMAWAAADALAEGGTVDERAWHRARATFATHVVED
ncbi:MAG: FAD-dependent oxidoreductase [Acidimicrobiia bacterium]